MQMLTAFRIFAMFTFELNTAQIGEGIMRADESPASLAETTSGANAVDALPDVTSAPPPVIHGAPVEISDGVFVIPDDRVPSVPNIGIVVGVQATLIVDSGIGRRNGAYVLEQARHLAGQRPLFLTITHFHPEHGFGAQAFKGEATIVYNRSQREELHRKGSAYVDMFRGFGPNIAAELEDVELVDPDVCYDGYAEIDLGGHIAVLQTWGPAHTASDQTVFVDGRVLFGGDLFETRMFPIAPYFPPYDADVDGAHWIQVLDQLMALNPHTVVPGHGEVTDVTVIRGVRDYLDYVRTETARLQASGAAADQAASAIVKAARERWSTWDNPEWIALAARAFYASLTA